MEVANAVENLLHDFGRHGFRDASFPDDVFEEFAPSAELHDNVEIALVVECLVELDDVGVVHFSESADFVDQQLHINVDRVFIYSFDCELFTWVVDQVGCSDRPEVPAPDHLPEAVVLLDVVFQVEDLLDVVVFLLLTKKMKFHSGLTRFTLRSEDWGKEERRMLTSVLRF